MNRIWVFFAVLFAALVLGGGLLLRPGNKELALMELKDRNFSEARMKYEAMTARGDYSMNVIVPLIKIYQEEGDIQKAIVMMEEFTARHPTYESVQYLGQLYLDAQMPMHYLHSLEQQNAIRSSPKLLRELVDRYDLVGDYDKENQTLALLVASNGYKPREDDCYKLAAAYSIQHKPEEAEKVLDLLLKSSKYDVSEITLNLYLDLLLQSDQQDKVLKTAQAYLERNKNTRSIANLSGFLRGYGRSDLALEMLKSYDTIPDPNDELFSEWVNAKLALGDRERVYTILLKRFNAGMLPLSLQDSLMDLALRHNDFALLNRMLEHTSLAELPADTVMRLTETAVMLDKPDLAKRISHDLGDDYLKDNPLLAAFLDIALTHSPASISRIAAVQNQYGLSEDQKILLIEIYGRYGNSQQVFALLKTLPVKDIVDNYDPAYVAELYAGVNQADVGMKLLDESLSGLNERQQARVQRTRGLLMIAMGDNAAFEVWLKQHPMTPEQLEDAFDIASLHWNRALGVKIARMIFDHAASSENRFRLIEALMAAEDYEKAFTYLNQMSLKDRKVQETYMAALSGIVKSKGAGALASYRPQVEQLIARYLERPGITPEEKRQVGYLLVDAGYKAEAARIFFSLAQTMPPDSPDVQEVLYIWGKDVPVEGVSWLTQKASAAQADEKAEWLSTLQNAGQSQAVIEAVGNGVGLTSKAMDIYMEALIGSGGKKRLGSFLSARISGSDSLPQLKKFTRIALGENLQALAEEGYRKIIAMDPNDLDAQKYLASIDYGKGQYSEAETLLASYLARAPGDAESNYIYGELLWRKKHYKEANQQYNEASNHIALNPKDNFDERVMQARILYRKNNVEQAIQLYRQLLSERPNDKELRADFADMLLNSKRYEEAKNLLRE